MRSILVLAATIFAATVVCAQESPPPVSEKGPNFPTPEHGPAYPAVTPDQGPALSFGARAPAPEQRGAAQQELPEQRSYPSGRDYPAQPER